MKKIHVVIASFAVSSMVLGADFAAEAKRLKANAGKAAPLIELETEATETEESKKFLVEGTDLDIEGLKAAKEKNDEEELNKLLANLDTKSTPVTLAAATTPDQDKGDSAFRIRYYGSWPSWSWGGFYYLGSVYTTWWVPVVPVIYTYYTYTTTYYTRYRVRTIYW